MLKGTNNKSRMLQSSVLQKIREFREAIEANEPVLYKLKEDVTLFANFFFKNPLKPDEDFIPYAWQNTVFQDNSKRICCCTGRQIGKSTVAILKAIHYAYFNDSATIIVVSKTFGQAVEVVDKIHGLLKSSSKVEWESIKPPSEKESRGTVKIKNAGKKTYSRILSVPATDAARGFYAHLVIADEGAFWENGDYIFKQVVEPTTQKTKGQILLLSTPNGSQGFFYEAFQNPNWNSYQYDWRSDPDTTEKEMETKKAGMTSLEFSSEYEAEFVSPRNAYFPYHMVIDATDNQDANNGLLGTGPAMMGVDFGKINDQSIIMIGTIDNPKAEQSEQMVRVVKRTVKPLGTMYSSIIGEIKTLAAQFKVSKIVLDSTGVGTAPAELLRSEGLPVEEFKFSLQSKNTLFTPLRMLFEQKRIKIPKDNQLIDQLTTFMYEYTISGNLKLYAPEGGHDDECFVAGTLILTDRGNVPIEKIKVGDKVLTRKGFRKVSCTGNRVKEVISKFGLTGTPGHPFITTKGTQKFINVKASDQSYIWNEKQSRIEEKRITDILSQKEDNSEFTSGIMENRKNRQLRCTDNFTKTTSAKYLKETLSTTKTETPSIILWKTSNACQVGNILKFIQELKFTDKLLSKTLNLQELPLQNGTAQPREENGTKNIMKKEKMLCTKKDTFATALNAERNIEQTGNSNLSSVITPLVGRNTTIGKRRVYNLKVEGEHEYFANNILVHNCDALALMTHGLVGLKQVKMMIVSKTTDKAILIDKTHLQVCDSEKGGCGEYFQMPGTTHHYEPGHLCLKCRTK